jgi:hypothetical protein
MSIQLPPKPWNEGDTFVNSQEGGTNVTYIYDGVKWIASGGKESDLSAFATNVYVDEVDRTAIMRDDALKKEHDEDSAKQSVINAGVVVSLDELFWRDVAIEQGAREDDEKLQAQIDALEEALPKAPLPQFRLYTGDFIDDWNPGDMAFCDASGDNTTTLSAVRSVLFHAEDINGKRWARDKNSTGYRRNYSSSLSVLLPDGEQTIFSMSPSHNILAEIYHITDFEDYRYDMYVISWTGLTSACLTSSMESVTAGDTYLLHVPEIFF